MSYPIKIVISGPVGAGKTTFVENLSAIPVVTTDEQSTEDIGKEKTTVAFDFGSFPLEEYEIYLFGTPGQERFDYMWEVLCEGAMGLLLLIDGTKVSDFAKARKILDFITSQVAIPYVIGITHQDARRAWGPEEISAYFQVPIEVVTPVDPRDPNQSLQALYLLFGIINERMEEVPSDTAPI